MSNRTRRTLVTATALIGLMTGLFGTAHGQVVLSTPAGLNPGDTFRFIFVTTGTTDATSSNIATYDAFVNTDAAGAKYNGVAVNWQVVGSTSTVDAITHLGTNAGLAGVYLPNGTRVATSDGTSAGGLWASTLQHSVNQLINGSPPSILQPWTGTQPNGVKSTFSLGLALAKVGNVNVVDGGWVSFVNLSNTQAHPLYAMSEVLQVSTAAVPEPSPALLSVLVASAALVARRRRIGNIFKYQ
ncbi:MAG: PEP-CTERM sorting domain-containing protein [Isosphaeraceae bacterium]